MQDTYFFAQKNLPKHFFSRLVINIFSALLRYCQQYKTVVQ